MPFKAKQKASLIISLIPLYISVMLPLKGITRG